MIFLSNEAMPVALEEDDRRHAVIWTPRGLMPEFYEAVDAELRNGGIAALHHYLLNDVDLGDFHENTRPPYTEAKQELIGLGLDSPTRFFYDLMTGQVGKLPFAPCLARDAYDAYKAYCHDIGMRPAPMPKFVNSLKRKHDVQNTRERWLDGQVVSGPNSFLLFGPEQPPGKMRPTWLGDCVDAFRNAMTDSAGGPGP
jgi:putative DNA primase/helicase